MTAVEWLIEQIENNVHHTIRIPREFFEQAKELEKEQNIDFARKCLEKAKDLDVLTAFLNTEQYYNETFKQQEQ